METNLQLLDQGKRKMLPQKVSIYHVILQTKSRNTFISLFNITLNENKGFVSLVTSL